MLFSIQNFFNLNYFLMYNYLLQVNLQSINYMFKIKKVTIQSFIFKHLDYATLKKKKKKLFYQKIFLLMFYFYFLKKVFYQHIGNKEDINIILKFTFCNKYNIFQLLYLFFYENDLKLLDNKILLNKNFFLNVASLNVSNFEALKKLLFKNVIKPLQFKLSFIFEYSKNNFFFLNNLPFFFFK